jgi:hypothetical protein
MIDWCFVELAAPFSLPLSKRDLMKKEANQPQMIPPFHDNHN